MSTGGEGSTEASATDHIRTSSPRPGVRLVIIDRPERLNAFTQAMITSLGQGLVSIADDPTCRVVVLTGSGGNFSAGLDLGGAVARRSDGPLDPRRKLRNQERFTNVVSAVRSLRVPVIAAVEGHAIGVGFALTLASDIRIASRTSSFRIGALRAGLTGGESGMSYLLPRAIGTGPAFEVLLTGRPISAEEAALVGLVGPLVEEGTAVDRALAVAELIIGNSPFGVEMTKKLMWANLDAPSFDAAVELENRTQMLVSMGPDTGEAMRAILEKRPPVFSQTDWA